MHDGLQGSEGQSGLDGTMSVSSPPPSDALPGPEAPPELPPDDRYPILWHSNAPWVGSGYGTQSALFAPRIAETLGYRLAFSAFWGLGGAKLGWVAPSGTKYVVYPRGRDPHGNEVMGAHFKDWTGDNAGMFVLLSDPWVFDAKITAKLPAVAWIPIDHDPLIPLTKRWVEKSRAVPVAMSRFGQRVMSDAGIDSLYVPHGFDPAIFHPTPRSIPRKAIKIPESAFVVGIVAANQGVPSRKCWPEMVRAFSIFKERHDDALLYIHSSLQPGRGGVDLTRLCQAHRVHPLASPQYHYATHFPDKAVAGLYNAFDVLLSTSAGEGFGVPMIESQACGTPVITTNFSACPEVAPVEKGNWNVGGQEFWTNFESYQIRPNVEEIVEALESAYSDSEKEREDRRISVAYYAGSEYTADHITETYWKPVLEEARVRLRFRDQQATIVDDS